MGNVNSKQILKSDLVTDFGAEVTVNNVWQEYPRPQLRRSPESWKTLNGLWNFSIYRSSASISPPLPVTPPKIPDDVVKLVVGNDTTCVTWGKILVPFPIESRLSRVQVALEPSDALVYERSFTLPVRLASEFDPGNPGAPKRAILHFEAVDYHAHVWVNQQLVGTHAGGNTRFSFDITSALLASKSKDPFAPTTEHQLVVKVYDKTGGYQLRGKQTLKTGGIYYTRASGIWQSVWIEALPERYIESLQITTDIYSGTISVGTNMAGGAPNSGRNEERTLEILNEDKPLNPAFIAVSGGEQGLISVKVENPKLWSPSSPFLYELRLTIVDQATGSAIDTVATYTALRKIGKSIDKKGNLQFKLNHDSIFHWGPLDQGWWPDGLLTPPSEAAMRADLAFIKHAGFNMVRKHIKVEPAAWYYECDRLGLLVWQDQVSGGPGPTWTHLAQFPQDKTWPEEDHEQWMRELDEMMAQLSHFPCIAVWTVFNEAWGQHRTLEATNHVLQKDSTRLVNSASGGNFFMIGDIADQHSYPAPSFPADARFKPFIKVVGEFGGHAYRTIGHIYDPNNSKNWGYGRIAPTIGEYTIQVQTSIKQLGELKRRQGIAGGVYTQLTDVEIEVNGILTYDRKRSKIDADDLRHLAERYLYNDVDEDNGFQIVGDVMDDIEEI